MAKDAKRGTAEARREYRRRRRIRNQILAYLTLVVLVGGIVAGGYFGVCAIKNRIPQKAATEAQAGSEDGQVQEAVSGETSGEGETPEEYIPEDFTPSSDFDSETDAVTDGAAQSEDGEAAEAL